MERFKLFAIKPGVSCLYDLPAGPEDAAGLMLCIAALVMLGLNAAWASELHRCSRLKHKFCLLVRLPTV